MQIKKATGEWQDFAPAKLENYLIRLDIPQADRVVEQVEKSLYNGKINSTIELRQMVGQILNQLPSKGQLHRAKYLLKDAIYALGPSGYNFEKFVAKLFIKQGYTVEVGKFISGKCVQHEVDVTAIKANEINFIECKFHNKEGTRSPLTTALYVDARFNDIDQSAIGWLATNTKLTNHALKYAKCAERKIFSLTKPEGNSITDLVIRHHVFPVTSLNSVKDYHQQFLAEDIITIRDLQRALETKQTIIADTDISNLQKELAELL